MSHRFLVTSLSLWAASCALGGAWAAAVSQGETASAPLCVDTGNARITRLCANVALRYKIDALMDVPLSNYGVNWAPTSWTISLPDGSSKAWPHERLPATVTKALAATTLQLKGTALVDFSATAPLQFLQYQTSAVGMHNKTAWTGVIRNPMEKWLFMPGQCQDGSHQSMDPVKAMALYKLGVKSLSIDPRSSASVCKAGTVVGQLDAAVRALDSYCRAEASHPVSQPDAIPGLCRPSNVPEASRDKAMESATQARWAAVLDDGVPVQQGRPTMALLDDKTDIQAPRLADRGDAVIQKVSSAAHFPE